MAEPLVEPRLATCLSALRTGAVLLHPTDTLPGLTVDPRDSVGVARLTALKARPDGKAFIGLVGSLDVACRWWEPLPSGWRDSLKRLWPGPVTVVWRAAADAPRSLVAPDGTLALRVPLLPEAASWFARVLEAVDVPLPTTSVNYRGEAAATTWSEAVGFLEAKDAAVIPDAPELFTLGGSHTPSTIIRIEAEPEGDLPGFALLRIGALSEAAIRAVTSPQERL